MSKSPHILFITLSNIGDAVMTTPVLSTLLDRYPAAKIDVSARKKTAPLFENLRALDRMLIQPERGSLLQRLVYIRRLRERQYDVVVDLKSSVLPLFLNANEKFGRVTPRSSTEPAVVTHMRSISPAVRPAEVPPTTLWLNVRNHEYAHRLLANISREGPLIALGPGANWEPKCWPVEYFKNVMLGIWKTMPEANFIIIGDKRDEPRIDFLKAALPFALSVTNAALNDVAAVLQRSSVFIGNDSGLGHIAAASGSKTVTIFGPGEPHRYRPWGPKAIILEGRNGDISKVQPDEVIKVLRRLLNCCP